MVAYGCVWVHMDNGCIWGDGRKRGGGGIKTGFEGPSPATRVECTRLRSGDIFGPRSYPGIFLGGNEKGRWGV